jgi:hypothetical protein
VAGDGGNGVGHGEAPEIVAVQCDADITPLGLGKHGDLRKAAPRGMQEQHPGGAG